MTFNSSEDTFNAGNPLEPVLSANPTPQNAPDYSTALNTNNYFEGSSASPSIEDATLDLEPQSATIDNPPFNLGFYTVGDTGEVGFDYLLNGGAYQGELGIFSLSGLGKYEIGSNEFIEEAARRALSSSTEGHIVISEQTEGARYTTEDADYTTGKYEGLKTFEMNPGDQFGLMLVPDGTMQELLDNPAIGGNKQPIFSLAPVNPQKAFHIGQVKNITGVGKIWAMEDLSANSGTDKDFNDFVFYMEGAVGNAPSMETLINPKRDWRNEDIGKNLMGDESIGSLLTPQPEPEPTPTPEPEPTPTPEPEPIPKSKTHKYEFTYFFNGENDIESDYYTGWVFAEPGKYKVDTYEDPNPENNETDKNGRYLITKDAGEANAEELGKVFVDKYYDSETKADYVPIKYGKEEASGTSGLSSEYDHIGSNLSRDNDFGIDKFEYDLTPKIVKYTDSKEYTGAVWTTIKVEPGNEGKEHKVTIDWGNYRWEGRVNTNPGQQTVTLWYEKRNQDSIPRIIKLEALPKDNNGAKSVSAASIFNGAGESVNQKNVEINPNEWKEILPGYQLIESEAGVALYGDNEDSYLQSVDLSTGASLALLHGDSNFEGESPYFERQSIEDAWKDFKQNNEQAFSIINGEFFGESWWDNLPSDKTQLSFPLKVDGEVISLGVNNKNDKRLKTFEISNGTVSINPFERNKFINDSFSAPDVLTGFNYNNYNGSDEAGKTFIGIKDSDFRNGYETVLILTSRDERLTNDEAKKNLENFGASEIIVMDSGGSTALRSNKSEYLSTKWFRTIPQTIGTLKA